MLQHVVLLAGALSHYLITLAIEKQKQEVKSNFKNLNTEIMIIMSFQTLKY